MQEESHIPVQIEKFWANNSNKENLQKLAKEFFINKSIENQINAVLSGCLSDNEDGCLKAVEVRDEFVFDRADLDIDIEEADLRIIPHVSKLVSRNFTNIVVISNDTCFDSSTALFATIYRKRVRRNLGKVWSRWT